MDGTQHSPHHFIAFVRHGERADQVKHVKVHNVVDPLLTPTGARQSKKAGEYLASYFEENEMKFDHVSIISSPFLRCIQTAAQIAKAMNVNDIEIHYSLSEAMNEEIFPKPEMKKPLNNIEYTKHNYDVGAIKAAV